MKKLFILVTIFVSLLSCNEDEILDPVAQQIDGRWELTESISLVLVEFDENEILWDFDTSAGVLSIENNSGEKCLFCERTGEYSFVFTETTIEIVDGREYQYTVENDTMEAGYNTALDGPLFTLIRK